MDNLSERPNAPARDSLSSNDSKQRFRLSALEILFGILILIGLIYIVYFILTPGSSGTAALEKKISLMETQSLDQAEKFDKRIKAIQDNQVQLQAQLKSVEALTRDLSAKIGKLEKRQAEEKKPSQAKEKIHYKVKQGETLQSIA
jgi:TolA-binding protein